MAIGKCDTFLNQPIQVRGLHEIKSQSSDRVVTLLVCDNEDDIGSRIAHCVILRSASLSRFVGRYRYQLAGRDLIHRYAARCMDHADVAVAPMVDCENLFMSQY